MNDIEAYLQNFVDFSKKYLKLINEAKVYDVAIKTPIIFAKNLTSKDKNKIFHIFLLL